MSCRHCWEKMVVGDRKEQTEEKVKCPDDTCLFHQVDTSAAWHDRDTHTHHGQLPTAQGFCSFFVLIWSNYFAKALHFSLPPFVPVIPTNLLPYLTGALLIPTFALAFYFSTYVPPLISNSRPHILFSIPKHTVPIWETVVASLASILGGFGVVALFCSVGVYV